MNSRTELKTVGEFGLIERIKAVVDIRVDDATLHDHLMHGIGDDAALFRPTPGKVQIFSTDMIVEGVHFDLTYTSFRHLGWKALISNISDIVAMGGIPRYATVALALPQKVSVEMIEELYGGMAFACQKYSCLVVGGDVTAASGNTVVSVAITGEATEDNIVRRDGARPGDLLCVTGELGAAHAGLKILMREKENYLKQGAQESFKPTLEPYKRVLEKYLMPKARMDIGRFFAGRVKVHSLIDISDGLASEVHHLCRASQVGAEVWEHNLPISEATHQVAREFSESPTTYALYGGEEYELLFTLSDEEFARLEKLTDDVTILGRIVDARKGIELVRENGKREILPPGGWDHFKA